VAAAVKNAQHEQQLIQHEVLGCWHIFLLFREIFLSIRFSDRRPCFILIRQKICQRAVLAYYGTENARYFYSNVFSVPHDLLTNLLFFAMGMEARTHFFHSIQNTKGSE
jgi:hypothetical protein